MAVLVSNCIVQPQLGFYRYIVIRLHNKFTVNLKLSKNSIPCCTFCLFFFTAKTTKSVYVFVLYNKRSNMQRQNKNVLIHKEKTRSKQCDKCLASLNYVQPFKDLFKGFYQLFFRTLVNFFF